jgi:hypothetical protein
MVFDPLIPAVRRRLSRGLATRAARVLAGLAALVVIGGTAFAVAGPSADDPFPHAKHAGLFPTCLSCHQGVADGTGVEAFPPAASCANCHDGVQYDKVPWAGRTPHGSNLRFSHVKHAAEADSATRACGACHGEAGRPYMAVAAARGEACVTCHDHKASAHLAADNTQCRTCHVTLPEATQLAEGRIAAFPKPPSHDAPGFPVDHKAAPAAGEAQCSICHTQESCARCHVNAATQATVQALGRDARVARLVAGKPGRYPVPANHRQAEFDIRHGPLAETEIARCANCHARRSCETCHIGTLGRGVIEQLPVPAPGGAQGVRLERTASWAAASPMRERYTLAAWHPDTLPASSADTDVRRVRPHPPGYVTHHGTEAAAGPQTCQGCHTEQRFCSDCHDGEGRRRFHPPNFTMRHPSDAYGREKDCALCHQPEIFCRSCHVQTGLASDGGSGPGYHNAQPLWLLQHGRAARQQLQSCTTCHTQLDCMQCHSQVGWKVNPHGANFNARAMWNRNRLMCLRCHATDPILGG